MQGVPKSMILGLRKRLLVWLLVPLIVLALVGSWIEYLWADEAASRADQQLARLLTPLADSVLPVGSQEDGVDTSLLLIMAPPVEEFLRQGAGATGFSVWDLSGRVRLGDEWIRTGVPRTTEPEFHSIEYNQVLYRVALQRGRTAAGELVVAVADGSDPSQHWGRQVLWRVLVPHLILIACAAWAIHLGVRLAFRPLEALTRAVERRSPRDLHPIDEAHSPLEVRPLVRSLNHLFTLVEAQADAQRRFIADAAHQLRTPLAGLQAQVEAWAMAPHTPGSDGHVCLTEEQITKLRDAARRTSKLAHQLLSLSQLDQRGKDAASAQPVQLKALCDQALEDFLDAAAAKDIDLGLDVRPVEVRGHEWLLRELLLNLVDNALKYAPPGSSVTLRCARDTEGCAILEVEDDGPGIAETERGKVIQRFYRMTDVTLATQGQVQGSGLGLAIAHEIARLHDADLTLARGPRGRGLRVTVRFAVPAEGPDGLLLRSAANAIS
nr:ATP-binding protein [Diaphorobacter sp.]